MYDIAWRIVTNEADNIHKQSRLTLPEMRCRGDTFGRNYWFSSSFEYHGLVLFAFSHCMQSRFLYSNWYSVLNASSSGLWHHEFSAWEIKLSHFVAPIISWHDIALDPSPTYKSKTNFRQSVQNTCCGTIVPCTYTLALPSADQANSHMKRQAILKHPRCNFYAEPSSA